MALTDKLSAIANALREKTGKTDLMTLDQMPSEVVEAADLHLADILNKTCTEIVNPYVNTAMPGGFQKANTNLIKIDMENITSISEQGCDSCSNLVEVNLPHVDVFGNAGLRLCKKLENVCLPRATTMSTGWGSQFHTCTNLKRVHLPEITNVAQAVFIGCNKLETLILGANTVATLTNSNSLANSLISSGSGYIYVPKDLVMSYQSDTNWALYADQFRAIEDYPEIVQEEGFYWILDSVCGSWRHVIDLPLDFTNGGTGYTITCPSCGQTHYIFGDYFTVTCPIGGGRYYINAEGEIILE